MMKEKEVLITDKYKLSDDVKTAKKQLNAALKKSANEKESLEATIEEKNLQIAENTLSCDKLQREIVRLRVSTLSCEKLQ